MTTSGRHEARLGVEVTPELIEAAFFRDAYASSSWSRDRDALDENEFVVDDIVYHRPERIGRNGLRLLVASARHKRQTRRQDRKKQV